jgi:hypothetical protein
VPSRRPPAAARSASAALAIALLVAGARAGAQAPGPRPDAVPLGAPYERARALVEEGRGAEGRAVIDSLLRAAERGSPAYAEALWWRAALARDVADAERDLRTLAVELPASPRAVDATLRLAQLELARGRAGEARERLERLRREQPAGATRALASYWLARAQLDAGDARTACGMLNEAAGAALPGDPAARQVVALRRRLPGCELMVAVGSAVGSAAGDSAVPAADSSRAARAGDPPHFTDTTRVAAAPSPAGAPSADSASVDAPRPTPPPGETPRDAAAPAPTAAAAPSFTVQLAAYDRREPAEQAAARLVARGVEARVVGTAAPFRVRVGRWPTRAAAAAAQRALAARGMRGWVAEEREAPAAAP